VIGIVTVLVIVVAVAYGKSIKALAKERQDALAKATDSADESIANIRTGIEFLPNALSHTGTLFQ